MIRQAMIRRNGRRNGRWGALRRLAGAGLAALALLGGAGQGAADPGAIDLSGLHVTPNPRLGLSFPGNRTRHYPALAEAGIGVVRLAVSWERVEPRPGRFDWGGLDERVRALLGLGIAPFLTFESDAEWAVRPETRKVRNAAPKDLADWSRFVGRVAERYDGDGVGDMPGLRGRVPYYQAANEWESPTNRSGGWIGSGAELVAYVNAAYGAVKAADPQAVFVLGGLAAFNLDVALVALESADLEVRQSWSATSQTVLTRADMRGAEIRGILEERVLPVLREARFDMADAHLYGPEDRDAARMALVARLTGRPVLSAECGGPSLDYGGSYTPAAHFLAVTHRNLNVLAADGAFCLWFRLGEAEGATWGNRFTALYDERARPKPGVHAYRMLARLISPQARVRDLGREGFEIARADGPVRLGWGSRADAVRIWAAQTGAPAYCLADPARGLLAPLPPGGAAPCGSDAFILAGPAVPEILSP